MKSSSDPSPVRPAAGASRQMGSGTRTAGKFLALLALAGTLGWWGCQAQAPTQFISVPTGSNSPSMVIDFETAGAAAVTVNSQLAEAGVPGNVVQGPGYASLDGAGATMGVVSPGANGTAYALQVDGPVTGTQCQLTISLDTKSTSGYYNASLFKGVEFYLRVMGDDNTTSKFFSIPIAQTMPVGNKGTCIQPGCYDHFGYTYQSTGGNWQLVVLDFSALKRSGYGNPVNPPTLTGANLEQFVQLQWQENSDGTSNADFGVDEVQFY